VGSEGCAGGERGGRAAGYGRAVVFIVIIIFVIVIIVDFVVVVVVVSLADLSGAFSW